MARRKLGEMLVEVGALTEQGLSAALAEQRRWGGTLGRTLIEMKLLTEAELVHALSAQLKLEAVDLDKLEIDPTVLALVPGDFAEQHSIVPFAQPMKFLDVAMAEPTNLGVLDELRIRTQLNIRQYIAGPKMIERALAKHYRRGLTTQFRSADGRAPTTPPLPGPPGVEVPRKVGPTGPPLSIPPVPQMPSVSRDDEIDALQERISNLEALVQRDEEVLRKMLAILVEKGVATREEILERIR